MTFYGEEPARKCAGSWELERPHFEGMTAFDDGILEKGSISLSNSATKIEMVPLPLFKLGSLFLRHISKYGAVRPRAQLSDLADNFKTPRGTERAILLTRDN